MSTQPQDYKVRLDVFEGPLDLLLYLIRKEEVSIYDIPIERITGQYMQYLDMMRMLDLNIAGEFLVMAATLMMIKSRMLLPAEERAAVEDEEEGDPRWDLVRQLVEYKKFKDAAQFLQVLEHRQEDVFTRDADPDVPGPTHEVALQDVSLFDLLGAFQKALQRVGTEELREIFSERFTVGEKIDHLLDLMRERDQVSLTELFGRMHSRHEIVVTFLAMLELIRLRQLSVVQAGQFGEIIIRRAAEG